MPLINWVYLCDYAFIDAAGKKSVIGMFEFIKAHKLPLNWSQLYIAVDLMVSEGENFKLKVLLSSPLKKGLGMVDIQVKSPGANQVTAGKTTNIFLPLGFFNLKFSETGEYHIEMFVDDIPIHSIPLNIIPVS